MFMRFAIPAIIIGLLSVSLLGWAVAYWHDRKTEREYRKQQDADQ